MPLSFCSHYMKKKVAHSVFFSGFCVVYFSGSWCSASTDEGGNRFFKGFSLFDTVQCQSEPHQLKM